MKHALQPKTGKAVFFALLLGCAFAAQASIPGYGLHRLFMVAEWNQLCAELGTHDKAANCKASLHRATLNGRTINPFELINPADSGLLQSRSGVLFLPQLNEKIVRVKEDNGMRTTVRLQEDIQCQAYATTPHLVGAPRTDRNYRRLVQSWLDVYSDAASEIRNISVSDQAGRKVLRFDAVTESKRVIRGTYMLDAQANASIFSTCDHPADSGQAFRNSELFFSSIVGSVRRFS